MIFITLLCFKQWVGIYYPYRWNNDIPKSLGTTLVELKHRVRWGIAKMFLRSFFVLLLMLQEGAQDAQTIPVSILVGLVFGVAVDYGIYKCRRFESERARRCSSIFFVVLFMVLCIVAVGNGVLFIAAVWDTSEPDVINTYWDLIAFLLALFLLPAIHVMIWRLGRRGQKRDEAAYQAENPPAAADDKGGVISSVILSDTKGKKQRMAMSMWFSDRNAAKILKECKDYEDGDDKEGADHLENVKEGEEENDDDEETNAKEPEEAGVPPAVEEEGAADKNANGGGGDEEIPPTLWELMTDWQCCGCARGEEKTALQKIIDSFVWVLYIAVCVIALFGVIINIGATHQQNFAREKLPEVNRLLYENINAGPVCAFDNRGADSNITTFPSNDTAHAAGFLILHCGACGACSDWENLEVEYTTRKFLALESRKCAQKSLFGGGYDTLVECLEGPTIGFQGQVCYRVSNASRCSLARDRSDLCRVYQTGTSHTLCPFSCYCRLLFLLRLLLLFLKCARCWADDILCTKSFCAMMGIQSFLINTIGNFEVGENTITSATCEEAHCEAGNPGFFVSCSGATRRRMGVKSSIARPANQRCTNVDVNWDELFPSLHPSDPDYKAN